MPTLQATTFNLADISGFFLSTDASANITDFSFNAANGDAFVTLASDPLSFDLENDGSPIDTVDIGITPVAEAVPEPSTLLGLLAVGSMGALTRKRKA